MKYICAGNVVGLVPQPYLGWTEVEEAENGSDGLTSPPRAPEQQTAWCLPSASQDVTQLRLCLHGWSPRFWAARGSLHGCSQLLGRSSRRGGWACRDLADSGTRAVPSQSAQPYILHNSRARTDLDAKATPESAGDIWGANGRRPGSSGSSLAVLPSVPTLAVGDVFLSCNTIAGLEHAEDWDFGSLSGGLLPGGGGEGPQPPASSRPPPPHLARPTGPPLDPASDLLLRMSPPVSGQRLLFVSKEAAEVVRRAMLLSRYDEILAERRKNAAAAEAAGSSAPAAGGRSQLRTSEGRRSSSLSSASRPAAPAAPTGGRFTGDIGGVAIPAAQPLATVPDLQGAAGGPDVSASGQPSTSSTSTAASTQPDARKAQEGVTTPWAGAGGANGGGGGGVGKASHKAGGGGTSDPEGEDLPYWLPGPLRQALAEAGRRVGGWLARHDPTVAATAVPRLVSELASRSNGAALDVAGGPRPRLPAAPLTSVMPLPPHVGAEAAAAGTRAGAGGAGSDGRGGEQAPGSSSSTQAVAGGAEVHETIAERVQRDSEELVRELRHLEEDRVVADAEALIRAGARGGPGPGFGLGGGGGGGGRAALAPTTCNEDGFLPPFSFSSYVARLPLEAALKALLSAPVAGKAQAAAQQAQPQPGPEPQPQPHASGLMRNVATAAPFPSKTAPSPAVAAPAEAVGLASAEVGRSGRAQEAATPADPDAEAAKPSRWRRRRRFLLVPDLADEQAVEGSRELERLVEEAKQSALAKGATDDEHEEGTGRGEDEEGDEADGGAGSSSSGDGGAEGRVTRDPWRQPRVALNLYDSDNTHWVLDVVGEIAPETGGNETRRSAGVQGQQGGRKKAAAATALPSERFIRGAPRGPSEDLGGLVHLAGLPEAAPPSSSPPGSSTSSNDGSTNPRRPYTGTAASTRPAAASASTPHLSLQSTAPDRDDAATEQPSGGTPASSSGRLPVFLVPGVTLSVRSADGTVLRLRPAFLSLQQLAAALAVVRDVAVAEWRRQRSAARWKVVSAMDVLTVHSAGFPIMRFSQHPSGGSPGAATGGANAASSDGDEDSDDGIPEAKELLREMGGGTRKPSPSAAAAAAASAASAAPPSGPLGVLSTLAVGVISFSAWCLASAVDVWDVMYSRTPWGLEEIGMPQHVNVRPTYLEDHVAQLAEANVPAVEVAAAAARARALQRAKERRARRRQAQTQQQQQQREQEVQQRQRQVADVREPGGASGDGGSQGAEQGSIPEAATAPSQPGHKAVPSGPSHCAPGITGSPHTSVRDGSAAAANAPTTTTLTSSSSGNRDAGGGGDEGQRDRRHGHNAGRHQHGNTGDGHFHGLALHSETVAGLKVLLQLTWAVVRAAQISAQRSADGGGGAAAGGEGGAGISEAAGLTEAGNFDTFIRLTTGRGSRDGSSGGLGFGGGATGLTLTASQDGELGLVARVDIRPVVAAGTAADRDATDNKAAQQQKQQEQQEGSGNGEGAGADAAGVSKVPASGAVPASSASDGSGGGVAGEGASATAEAAEAALGGGPGADSQPLPDPDAASGVRLGRRVELPTNAAKLASQVKRPHKFEVGLHLNLRKLLGDLPEDAPDVLLPHQQPAGVSTGPTAAAAAGAVTGSAALSQRMPYAAPHEAYGMILVGDLGLDGAPYDDHVHRPPSMGFADLAGLVAMGESVEGPGSGRDLGGLWGSELLGVAAGSQDEWEDSDADWESDQGSRIEGAVAGQGLGVGLRGRGLAAGGWAARGRGPGGWGRWGR